MLVAVTGCGARPAPIPPSTPRPIPPVSATITALRVGPGPGGAGEIAVVPVETYVEGVVAAEQAVGTLPAAIALEVLQVQAIISRTFALAHLGRNAREGLAP